MKQPVLLTGFEPFDQFAVNSSWEASRIVGEQMKRQVLTKRLPVDYEAARAKLIKYLTQHKPLICLCAGLTTLPGFCIERVARKPVQFSTRRGAQVLEGAWPWDEMENQLHKSDCPVSMSYDAGEYICESTYWSLLAFRQRWGYPVYAAFLHVPPLSPVITVEMIATALSRVIQTRLGNMNEADRPKRCHSGRASALSRSGQQ